MKWLVWCGLVMSLSCVPYGVPLDAPPRYEVWWKVVEACDHKQADIHQWTFAVSTRDTIEDGPFLAWALTYPGSRTIILSRRVPWCGKIVRHEMLHAIDPHYDATHPDSIGHRCAGIIAPPFTSWDDC